MSFAGKPKSVKTNGVNKKVGQNELEIVSDDEGEIDKLIKLAQIPKNRHFNAPGKGVYSRHQLLVYRLERQKNRPVLGTLPPASENAYQAEMINNLLCRGSSLKELQRIAHGQEHIYVQLLNERRKRSKSTH